MIIMSDLNWCTFCDNAISPFSKSLYCSDHCLRADALRNHPLLGYTYPECIHFARRSAHFYRSPPESVTVNHPFSNNRQQPSSTHSPVSNISAIDNSHLHLSNQQGQTTNNASKLVRLYAN